MPEPVELLRPQPVRWIPRLAAAVLAVEVALLWLLAGGRLGPAAALAAHAALVVGLGLVAHRLHRSGQDSRTALLLVVTTAVLGPFGAAGSLLSVGLGERYARRSTSFREWYATLFPEQEDPLDRQVYERVKGRVGDGAEAAELAPFVDLLSFGSLPDKLAVIAAINKHFKPAFAPLLRLALRDATGAIRVQAATAIALVESRFLERTLELSESVESRPYDPDVRLALARHYDDYAYTGLLDEARERENRERARAVYRDYLEMRPQDATARVAVGRLLLRDGRCREAAAWFEESFPDGLPSAQALLWYLECLYRLGRFSELRRLAGSQGMRWTDAQGLPHAAVEAVGLWAGERGPLGVAS